MLDILPQLLVSGLLIGGVLTFEQQIGPLAVMLVLLALWFAALGWLVTELGVIRRGIALGLVAATYLGFAVWALWLGRALLDLADQPSSWLAGDAPAVRP